MAWQDAMYAQLELSDWFARRLWATKDQEGEASWEAAAVIGAVLYYANPFDVSEDVVRLLERGAATLPERILRWDDVPCERGWVYYERPIRIDMRPYRADRFHRELAGQIGTQVDYVDLRGWCWRDERLAEFTKESLGVVFFADGWRGDRKLGYFEIAHYGYDLPYDREPDLDIEEGRRALRDHLFGHVLTFLLFIKQKVVAEEVRHVANRQLRKRAEERRRPEDGPLPGIRVVQLRKRDYGNRSPAEGGSAPVEWSCQWEVDPHWRHQWYPSLGEHRWKFIHLYTKGPEDKPLRVKRTAYEVKR